MKPADFREMVVARLTSIEHDLGHHIKRTDLLEERVLAFEKLNNFLTIAGRLLVIGAAIAGIAKLFLH